MSNVTDTTKVVTLYVSPEGTDFVSGPVHGTTPKLAFRSIEMAMLYARVKHFGEDTTVVFQYAEGSYHCRFAEAAEKYGVENCPSVPIDEKTYARELATAFLMGATASIVGKTPWSTTSE